MTASDALLQHLTDTLGNATDAGVALDEAQDALRADQASPGRRDARLYPGRDDDRTVADVFSELELDDYLASEAAAQRR